jgi:hypothetical protein
VIEAADRGAAVGADRIVFGLKRSFGPVVTRVPAPSPRCRPRAGATASRSWSSRSRQYLYGEETALSRPSTGATLPRMPRRSVGGRRVVEPPPTSAPAAGCRARRDGGPGPDAGSATLVDNVETRRVPASSPGRLVRTKHRRSRHHRVHRHGRVQTAVSPSS